MGKVVFKKSGSVVPPEFIRYHTYSICNCESDSGGFYFSEPALETCTLSLQFFTLISDLPLNVKNSKVDGGFWASFVRPRPNPLGPAAALLPLTVAGGRRRPRAGGSPSRSVASHKFVLYTLH